MYANSEQNPLHNYAYQIPGQERTYETSQDHLNYQQQHHDPHQPYSAEDTNGHFPPATNGAGSAALHQQIDQMKLDDFVCVRCNDGFAQNETVVNSGGQVWHAECFV
jgi:hypothetical protein